MGRGVVMWRGLTLALLGGLIVGCRDFGVGGTGEMVVPEQRVREIESIDLAQPPQPLHAPATQPSEPADAAEGEEPAETAEAEATAAPTTAPSQVELSIEDVRQQALSNNLDLSVELLEPSITRETLTEEQAAYEALFTTDARYSNLDQPLPGGNAPGIGMEQLLVDPGLEKPLQTGGAVRLSAPMAREQDTIVPGAESFYQTDLSLTLTQPLLRGAGTAANAQRIRVAFYRYQQSEALTKLEVIRVLANADRAYWRLAAARRELDVRRQQYDLAVAQLERARRLEAAGQAAEVEIARAESSAADRLEAIIVAENALRDRQRDVKRIMNQPGLEMGTATALIPTTDPRPVAYQLDPEQLSAVALERRMELLDIELQLAQQAAITAAARNDVLPLVSLEYTYNLNGAGGTAGDSYDLMAERDYEDHVLGLRMQVPIGNQAARSRLRRSLAQRMQLLASRAQREQIIRQEVLNSVDQLQANWQRIQAALERVRLAERLLEIESRQLLVGQGFDFRVLEAQVALAEAQSALIQAVADYQIAQVDIAFATGTLLGQSAIDWRPIAGPPK